MIKDKYNKTFTDFCEISLQKCAQKDNYFSGLKKSEKLENIQMYKLETH